MTERELVEKLAKAYAYGQGEKVSWDNESAISKRILCDEIKETFLPLIRAYASQVAAAERQRCIAKCQEILESRKNGHAAGIEAAHLCAMEIESLATTDALAETLRKARLEEARWWEHTVGLVHPEHSFDSDCVYCERLRELERTAKETSR